MGRFLIAAGLLLSSSFTYADEPHENENCAYPPVAGVQFAAPSLHDEDLPEEFANVPGEVIAAIQRLGPDMCAQVLTQLQAGKKAMDLAIQSKGDEISPPSVVTFAMDEYQTGPDASLITLICTHVR